MIRLSKTQLRVRLSRRHVLGTIAVVLLGAGAIELASETMTMVTYYPSPAGIYRLLTSTDQTILARDRGVVGIGTSHPNRLLTVHSETAGANISINTNAGAGQDASNLILSRHGDDAWEVSAYTDGNFYVLHGAGTPGANTPFAITAAGNVGVGNFRPTARLDVNGHMNLDGAIRLKRYAAPPFACDAPHDAAVAMTSVYTLCTCKPDAGWVSTDDPTQACAWATVINPPPGCLGAGQACGPNTAPCCTGLSCRYKIFGNVTPICADSFDGNP